MTKVVMWGRGSDAPVDLMTIWMMIHVQVMVTRVVRGNPTCLPSARYHRRSHCMWRVLWAVSSVNSVMMMEIGCGTMTFNNGTTVTSTSRWTIPNDWVNWNTTVLTVLVMMMVIRGGLVTYGTGVIRTSTTVWTGGSWRSGRYGGCSGSRSYSCSNETWTLTIGYRIIGGSDWIICSVISRPVASAWYWHGGGRTGQGVLRKFTEIRRSWARQVEVLRYPGRSYYSSR